MRILLAVELLAMLAAARWSAGRSCLARDLGIEPSAMRLHVAFGKGPTSALPLKALELTKWFQSK